MHDSLEIVCAFELEEVETSLLRHQVPVEAHQRGADHWAHLAATSLKLRW